MQIWLSNKELETKYVYATATIISVVYACNFTFYLTGWGGGGEGEGLLTPLLIPERKEEGQGGAHR
jgi:hypothetical protein